MKWFLRLVLAGGLRFGLYEVLSITWHVDCVGGEVAQMEKTHKSNLSLIRISENSFHMWPRYVVRFLCRISLYGLTREAWLHGLCQFWNISRWNVLDWAMHLYSLYLPHKCFELCWWRSWHQNGWSKKGWVGEMAGNVCASNGQNLATGKWGESPRCATYHKCTWRGHCTPSNITSAVVSSIQTRQFLLPTLFNLLHVARLITLIDLVNITIAGILSHYMRLSDAIIFEWGQRRL